MCPHYSSMGKEGKKPKQVRPKSQVSLKSHRACSCKKNSFNDAGREREEAWMVRKILDFRNFGEAAK